MAEDTETVDTHRDLARWQQIILDAKDVIPTEKEWTKGASARNRAGITTLAEDHDAVTFCLIGAMVRATEKGKYNSAVFDMALSRVRDAVVAFTHDASFSVLRDPNVIAVFNDSPGRTLEEVHTVMDMALES